MEKQVFLEMSNISKRFSAIQAMRDEWQSRKRKCMDFVDQLADGIDKKPREIIKLLDIETDEMEGVTMPPKRTIADAKITRAAVSQTIRK